jgi:Niemann-Pick C2 protein
MTVTIPGCDSPPCKLVKGTDVKVEVQFSTTSATKTLTPKVNTRFLGLSLPYDLPSEQKDGCQHIRSTSCPLDSSEFAIYELTMPILKSYPSLNIEIELNMLNDDNQSQFCFKVDCQVVVA